MRHRLGQNTYLPLGCGDEMPEYGMEISAVPGKRNSQVQPPGGKQRIFLRGGGHEGQCWNTAKRGS